jgi:hypothetical protein
VTGPKGYGWDGALGHCEGYGVAVLASREAHYGWRLEVEEVVGTLVVELDLEEDPAVLVL